MYNFTIIKFYNPIYFHRKMLIKVDKEKLKNYTNDLKILLDILSTI